MDTRVTNPPGTNASRNSAREGFSDTRNDPSLHRERRIRRQKQEHTVLLCICTVLLLLLLTGIVFLFCHVAFLVRNDPDNPNGKQTVILQNNMVYSGNLVTVDASHRCEVVLDGLTGIGGDGILLQSDAAEAVTVLLNGFSAAGYDPVTVGKGYVPDDPASDFRTGFTAQLIRSDGTPVSPETEPWLYQHCWKYGLIYQFANDGTDHSGCFRYIGLPHTDYMKQKSLTFDEYMDLLRNHTGENFLREELSDGSVWQIYYIRVQSPSDGGTSSVMIPKQCEYSVSGDNAGGLILAARLTAGTS